MSLDSLWYNIIRFMREGDRSQEYDAEAEGLNRFDAMLREDPNTEFPKGDPRRRLLEIFGLPPTHGGRILLLREIFSAGDELFDRAGEEMSRGRGYRPERINDPQTGPNPPSISETSK